MACMEKRGGTSACLLDALCNEMILPLARRRRRRRRRRRQLSAMHARNFALFLLRVCIMVLYTLAHYGNLCVTSKVLPLPSRVLPHKNEKHFSLVVAGERHFLGQDGMKVKWLRLRQGRGGGDFFKGRRRQGEEEEVAAEETHLTL